MDNPNNIVIKSDNDKLFTTLQGAFPPNTLINNKTILKMKKPDL